MLKIRLIPNKVMLNIYLRPFRNFSSTQKENSDIYLGSTSPGAIVPVSVIRMLVQKNATDGTSSLQPAAKSSTRPCLSFRREQDTILQDGKEAEETQDRSKTSDCH